MSGSEEYLTKSFDPDDLVDKVSKYLPRWSVFRSESDDCSQHWLDAEPG